MRVAETTPVFVHSVGLVIAGSPGKASAFADKTAPDPERVCLWEPESKIGPSCLRDSFFFDQSEYAALPVWLVTMWLFAFTRTQATNYDFFGGIVYVT